MSAQDISTTISTILVFFGGITCIVAGVSGIVKIFSPFKMLKEKVKMNEQKLEHNDERFMKLENAIEQQTAMQKEICKSLIVIMNHTITGNSKDKVKAQMEELQQYLIDH